MLSDLAISEERSPLVGGYFTHEYSFEAAALFNPSIVPHPDQSHLAAGSQRFVLSLRATGEGHMSSTTFRTGVADSDGSVVIDAPTRYGLEPARLPNASFEKRLFERKLRELNLIGAFSREVLKLLGESFTLEELRTSISLAAKQLRVHDLKTEKVAKKLWRWHNRVLKFNSIRTRAFPNACCSPPQPHKATASRMRVLFFFMAKMAHGPITRHIRPMMAN